MPGQGSMVRKQSTGSVLHRVPPAAGGLDARHPHCKQQPRTPRPLQATQLPPSCLCSHAFTSPPGSTLARARVPAAAAAPPWRLQG